MKVIFHPEASEEKLESARFYEARSEGLGSDFLAAVEETTRRIGAIPRSRPSGPSKFPALIDRQRFLYQTCLLLRVNRITTRGRAR